MVAVHECWLSMPTCRIALDVFVTSFSLVSVSNHPPPHPLESPAVHRSVCKESGVSVVCTCRKGRWMGNHMIQYDPMSRWGCQEEEEEEEEEEEAQTTPCRTPHRHALSLFHSYPR